MITFFLFVLEFNRYPEEYTFEFKGIFKFICCMKKINIDNVEREQEMTESKGIGTIETDNQQ